jgi:hypothetical protein
MRRYPLRSIAAALALAPLASTCTPPRTDTAASAGFSVSAAAENRLVRFLIDGPAAAPSRAAVPER